MRRALGVLHRWLGLSTAAFLFISGLTGAVIAFDHELDAWLNPDFYVVPTRVGEHLSPFELADRVEAAEPRLRITYLPLAVEAGSALQMFGTARIDPTTGEPFEVGFDQLAVDPATGAIQASREWGAVSLGRVGILPFLYKLHYTLHIPDAFGVRLGAVFMGIVAVAWTVDCFVSLYISFPNPKLWRRSFQFSWREGGRRLVFDLHRSGGVWVWALLLILAVTAVSMNLGDQIVRPIVGLFSPLTPDPFADQVPSEVPLPEPRLVRAEIVRIAAEAGASRGWGAPPGGVFYSPDTGLYGVGFFAPGDDHGDGGLGNPWLYFDGTTGEPAGTDVPGEGSWGDVFLHAQFPIHSGRILGFPGRVLASLMGLAVAGLSLTGVLLLARKRVRIAQTPSETLSSPAA